MPDPKPKIRFIRSCSSPLSPKTFNDLEAVFNAPVLEAYAMTEAAHQMTSNPLPPGQRFPGSVGIGQGVEVQILDENGDEVPQGQEAEICVQGENVTKGYLNNPSANATAFTKGGFFRTGDQGKKTKDGYIIITSRIKELINKGGEKISPVELDHVLMQHANIAEAVSFAIPDPGHYGEDIGVVVVLKGIQSVSEEALKTWMADKMAKFKVPKKVCSTMSILFIFVNVYRVMPKANAIASTEILQQIWIMNDIPKTATGKIQRRKIAEEMMKTK
jgi:acyl-CoA synthetase (AMP-forming)/AMP-acid ligase II